MSYTEARIAYEEMLPDDGEPSPEQLDLAFGDYQIVIADEAHHLRNVGTRRHDAVAEITTAGARKDMLLVTATPVNNSLRDLEHLLGLFLVSDDALVAKGISSWSRKVRDAIRMEERDDTVPEGFLYDLLDQVTVRRSRQFILDNPAAEGDTIRGADGHEQRVRFPSVDLRPRIQWDLGKRTKLVDDLMAHLDEDLADQADDEAPALTFSRYDLPGFSLDENERSGTGTGPGRSDEMRHPQTARVVPVGHHADPQTPCRQLRVVHLRARTRQGLHRQGDALDPPFG